MGSSFTEFHGCGFWAHDSSLEVWLYLLARQIKASASKSECLVAAAKRWEIVATAGFNGCVTADLDKFAIDQRDVAALIEFSNLTLAWLRKQGLNFSSELLNSFGTGGAGSHFTRDVPTENFVRVGQTFIQLLKKEIAWDAKTSPVI